VAEFQGILPLAIYKWSEKLGFGALLAHKDTRS
jgi:hypothetical protein